MAVAGPPFQAGEGGSDPAVARFCQAFHQEDAAALLGAGGVASTRETYVPLFVIERSMNKNVVHYDAVVTPDGRLNPRQPIVAYWVMAAEDGGEHETGRFRSR